MVESGSTQRKRRFGYARFKEHVPAAQSSHVEEALATARALLEANDVRGAVHHYYRAAVENDAIAQYELWRVLSTMKPRILTYGRPTYWLELAAGACLPDAQYDLATCYRTGKGVPQDLTKAIALYADAAESGMLDAIYWLGVLYVRTSDSNAAHSLAARNLCRAAILGHGRACTAINYFVRNGDLSIFDFPLGIRWFVRAVVSHEPDQQVFVALRYLRGKGLPKSTDACVRWLVKAARAGSGRALYNLGMMRLHGIGLRRDAKRAQRLLAEAADHGYTEAIRQLNLMQEKIS